jgi:hypothetical protein
MENRRWLDELRVQLSQKRLPPEYVARLMEELSDHYVDIQEEKMSTEVKEACADVDRLGLPQDLAHLTAIEYRKTFFCGRHPVLSFILLPVPLVLTLLIATCTPFFLCLYFGLNNLLGLLEIVELPLMLLCPWGISALILCRLATKSGLHWRWPLVSGTIISIFSGWIGMGAPGFLSGQFAFGWVDFGMLTIPLAVGSWYTWRSFKKQPVQH